VHKIVRELNKFSADLGKRERWLVLNKIDLLPDEVRESRCATIVDRLGWRGPVFAIAALSRQGTRELVFAIMEHLEGRRLTGAGES